MELGDLRGSTEEIKVEPQELNSDSNDKQQISKSDKHDGRVDVGAKDTKHERGINSEIKGHEKIGNNPHIGSHSQWEHKSKDEGAKAKKETGDIKKETLTESDKEAPKNAGRESIGRKKEREGDVESERPDKRIRSSTIVTGGGKTDFSCVVYEVGECVQEITNLWKEYESQADKARGSSQNGPTLEIRIPAEHVTATNRQVRSWQLWGTDIYTVDSDLVAVLMHTGYSHTTASTLPSPAQELRATIRVLPPQRCYISTLRNSVRSRAWGSAVACSYRVERCCIVKNGGGVIGLQPRLTQSSTMEPTLAPVAVEHRTMTTRAAASNALRQKKFLRDVTFQFNFCMEPWLKYSINAVADKGFKRSLFTSARLKNGEVLYVETLYRRYELCFNGEKPIKASISNTGNTESIITVDTYRWSRCKKPIPQETMLSIGIPLSLEGVEVLEENLVWDEIDWSQNGVWVAGKEYHLVRAHFLAPN